jgi:hypothetical protein
MELSHSLEATSRSATKEFPIFHGTRYSVHKSPPLVFIQMNPDHTTPFYFAKIHFTIILPPTSWSSY